MNDKFFKKNLPIAVLSTAMVSLILVACSKKDELALKDKDSNLSFSDELEPNLDLSEGGNGVNYNANGVSADGKYQPAELVDGVYQIANAGNLYWFAEYVNSGHEDVDAVLTADINVQWGLSQNDFDNKFLAQVVVRNSPDDQFINSVKNWVSIGNKYGCYKGEFDGNNHTITGIYQVVTTTDQWAAFSGLFGSLGNGANIHDVIIESSFFVASDIDNKEVYVGAISGDAYGATISNCQANNVLFNDNTMNEIPYSAGGILGNNDGSRVEACSSIVKICSAKKVIVGGLCGVLVDSGSIIDSETFVECVIQDKEQGALIGHICGDKDNGEIINCSYVVEKDINDNMFNIGANYGTKSKQNIPGQNEIAFEGSFAEPHRILVIQMGDIDLNVNYNANGVSADGKYQPAEFVDGVYQISNAGNLYWFAEYVNSGHEDVNAVLTADINVNEGDITGNIDYKKLMKWTPIGKDLMTPYVGRFNGNNKTISGLWCKEEGAYEENGYIENRNDLCVGLFGAVGNWDDRGAEIKNVIVKNSRFEISGREINLAPIAAFNLGSISGCFVDKIILNITGEDSGMVYNNIGGICGLNHSNIVNCKVGRVECKTEKTKLGDYGLDSTLRYNVVCGHNMKSVKDCYYLRGSGFKIKKDGIMTNVEDIKEGEVTSLTVEQWNKKYPQYLIK
ncbi:MAG: hypothetical protein J6C55_00575 [Oscillospiraceae bacterium]|nr:hypothetical protein [Oscillospiraceae bacterium]